MQNSGRRGSVKSQVFAGPDEIGDNEQLDRFVTFVKENFVLRRCKRYVPAISELNEEVTRPGDCACGRSFDWHRSKRLLMIEANNEPWSIAKDTINYPCNTFGRMIFHPGAGYDRSTMEPGASAKYIRLAGDRSSSAEYMENVYKLMTSDNYWGMSCPQIMLQVIGMSRKLQYVEQEIIERFTVGLVRAAKTAKCWIMTCGLNNGIASIVGDAISKARMANLDTEFNCIGITPWGVVNEREKLVGAEKKRTGIAPRNRGLSVQLEAASNLLSFAPGATFTPLYVVERPENCITGIPLNPGHNSFLLIDNGIEKKMGEEIEFTAKFMHFLSLKALLGSFGTVASTPYVLVVAGGDLEILKILELTVAGSSSVIEDIVDKQPSEILNPISESPELESPDDGLAMKAAERDPSIPIHPAVIVQHFGGISDLIAFAYKITTPPSDKDWKRYRSATPSAIMKEDSMFPDDFDSRISSHPALEQAVQSIPEKDRDSEITKALKRIRNCLRHRTMMTLVDLGDHNTDVSLDYGILSAILKSNVGSAASNFELAQLWDRPDIARSLLSLHENEIRENLEMKSSINRAIRYGQHEFFKLLIEYGLVDLNSFLTLYQMRMLYTDIFLRRRGKAEKSGCFQFFRCLLLNMSLSESALADVSDPEMLEKLGELLSELLGCYMDNVITKEKSYNKKDSQSLLHRLVDKLGPRVPARQLKPYETSLRDLFILQLLLCRDEFALYVWIIGHDHLGTALMASVFLKTVSKKAANLEMTDLSVAYREASRDWLNRAISLMATCYDQQPSLCSRLLTRSLLTWQGATLLEITFYGKIKKFMEQPPIQRTLAEVWLGQMANLTRYWLIYLTMLPPLLPFLIFKIRFKNTNSVQEYSLANALGRRTPPISSRKPTQDVSEVSAPSAALRRPGLTLVSSGNRISIFYAIYLLFSSPVAKYITHAVAVATYLFTFSTFVLDKPRSPDLSIDEVAIWICSTTFFLDQVREGFGKENLSVVERLQDFFSTWPPVAELISQCIMCCVIIIRLFFPSVPVKISHTIYAFICVWYWGKSSRFFHVTESIGPKIITLFKMLRDLAFFLVIYVVVLLSFAVPLYSLVYPHEPVNTIGDYFSMLINVAYDRLWNLFSVSIYESRSAVLGECRVASGVDNHNGSISNSTSAKCPQRNTVAMGMYGIYILLTNIMLLNMLIAMFSHTVTKTRRSATRIWGFDIYRFLGEYYSRPILPGPLMLPELFYRLLLYIYRKTCGITAKVNTDLKRFYSTMRDHEYRQLEMFERSTAEAIISSSSQTKMHENVVLGKHIRRAIANTYARLERIEVQMNKQLDSQSRLSRRNPESQRHDSPFQNPD